MKEFFKKYHIFPLILVIFFSTIFQISTYNLLNIEILSFDNFHSYMRYSNLILVGIIGLTITVIVLAVTKNDALYNKSYALPIISMAPMLILVLLYRFKLEVSSTMLISLYALLILIISILYVKNYDNLVPKNPLEGLKYYDNSLQIEILYILLGYGTIVLMFLKIFEVFIIASIILFILSKIFIKERKKTYLDEALNTKVFTVGFIVVINIVLKFENGLLIGSVIYALAVLYYFIFLRKRVIEDEVVSKNRELQ